MCTTTPGPLPEELRGAWSGEIEKFGLALTIHLADTCSVDSPDQGASGLRATLKSVSNGSIDLKFPDFHAGLKATLQGDTLVGTFSQMGIKSPIKLTRGVIKRNRPQTPQPPFPYDTEEVTIDNGDFSLSGTLTLPEAGTDMPAVVFVSGSGQQDRDETLIEHKPFAVIADALARAGIPSLRYDDRGCGGSGGNFEQTTTEGFASDAAQAVRLLRSRGFGKVGIIGHSEGGTIAFMLAGTEKPDDGTPDFIVSLAGMADRGDSTLLRQTTRMLTLQGTPEKAAEFAARISVKKIMKQKSPWFEYFVNLDPAPYIKRISCPTLALNGSLDSQVIPEYNLSKVQALCPGAECHLYPGLNHLFQHCSTGLSTEYAHLEETFAPEVITAITEWLLALK